MLERWLAPAASAGALGGMAYAELWFRPQGRSTWTHTSPPAMPPSSAGRRNKLAIGALFSKLGEDYSHPFKVGRWKGIGGANQGSFHLGQPHRSHTAHAPVARGLSTPALPSHEMQSGALAYGMKLDERIRVAPNAKLRASRESPQCIPLAAAASVVLCALLVVCGAWHAAGCTCFRRSGSEGCAATCQLALRGLPLPNASLRHLVAHPASSALRFSIVARHLPYLPRPHPLQWAACTSP